MNALTKRLPGRRRTGARAAGAHPGDAAAAAAAGLVLLCAGAVVAASDYDVAPERRSWTEDGATGEYYNLHAGLAWTRPLGDWRDALGIAHGDRPFATLDVADTDSARTVTVDVTALVARWASGAAHNLGMLLRATGSGVVEFRGREAPEAGDRPTLVIRGSGETLTRTAVADTWLTGSTVRAQGHQPRLRVGGGDVSLLRFDLDGVAGAVRHAELRLTTTERQYGAAAVGVFLAAPGEAELPPPEVLGLALEHPGDRGLRTHPDVLLATGFESEGWRSRWSRPEQAGSVPETVHEDAPLGFAPLDGRALKVVIPKGGNTGLNLLWLPGEAIGSEPEELWFRYYLRLSEDWLPVADGGKLPGLAGTYGRAGWGGRRADGTNGWSTRGSFGRRIPRGNPLAGMTPVGTYAYHADMDSLYGENWPWNRSALGVLERNRWYCIEQHVRLNTPGESDGVLEVWLDGRRAFEKRDIRYRTTPALKIDRVWMNVYHGGATPAHADLHLYLDNVVVARRYIGPLVP